MNISSILSNDNTTPPPIPGSSENQAGQPEIPNHSANVDKVSNGISNHYPKISDITNQDDGANDANDGANNGASDGASANAQTPVENSSSNHSGPLNEDMKNNEPPSMISSILAEPLENGYISNEDITNNEDLSYYEKNLSTINKLDRFNVKMANINILNHELANINKIINKSNGISNNYLERLVTEDVATKNNILIPNSKNHTSKEFHWGSSRVKDADYNDSLTSKRTRSATNNKFKQSTNTSKKLLNIAPAPNKKPNAKTKSKSRRVSDSDDSPSSKRFKTSESPIDNSSGKVKLKLTLKNQDAKKRKVQEDKARELIRQQELEKQKENHKQKQVSQTAKNTKEQKVVTKQYDNTYVAIWKDMSRKDGPKVSRLLQQSNQAKVINLKKTAILAAREAKRWQLRNNKNQKDLTTKARRAMREMFNFWKRNERVERELRKKHEKELLDKAKREEEDREAKRQSRKLNFLITQTELYSHFIGKKIKTDEIEGSDADPRISNAKNDNSHFDKYHGIEGQTTDFNSIDFDNDDEEALNRAAAANAQVALEAAQTKARGFDSNHNQDLDLNGDPLKNPDTNGEEMNFQNPTLMGDITITQPDLLKCSLKEYQIKGLNWLANLYEQGINGILADEMGLGKTVQSISVLAYLAEHHNIWGPFLVVTPASTLHNWQQEITKFVPDFKVLPYWGNAKDRKVLRKFWDRKSMRYGKDAPFHVLVTSYQLVVADAAYFQKMKWQYMILDEAQAIKSSQSSRWKSLLSFSSRNRLLLTGTPIQNSMQELWALLHFIMPSLFDSHDEFSDWFSKDIESHAQSNTKLNEQQLKRLHVILKPFMLRRIKKNVQSELGDKVEIDLFCDLTNRQKKYYQMLKSQISIMDILDTTNNDDSQSLMNLVMQFRKVCNHPDLFERADVKSSLSLSKFAETSSFLRESNELELKYSTENLIRFNLPRLIYDEILLPDYDNNVGSRNKISEMFNIYHPSNVNDHSNKTFDWLRFVDKSPQELNSISHQNLLERAIDHQSYNDSNYDEINRLKYVYDEDDKFIPVHKKLLINDYNNNSASISNSVHMKELYSIQTKSYEDMYLNVLPPAAEPVATAAPITLVCHEASFPNKWHDSLFDEKVRSALMPLSLESELSYLQHNQPIDSYPKSNMLPRSTNKLIDYSNIRMPSMTRFITESGKLATLDKLLVELKQNDHRVLVYFQMTKMMDLMEEYLSYRQHKYIRLDGSSKLDDRRDLVHDWQTKPEIFVFLLSTRAGGLGINLTAADTVIFYDSDWNPTIDSQAMDRAHRLGQTKQVTVYRLLARGTIEERMRDRAKQKEQVQQVVMEGKSTLVNKKEEAANKKKDVAFLLLGGDDDSASNSSIQPDSSDKKTVESANDSESNLQDNGNDSKESLDKNLAEMYHEDEGEFSKNPSGTVTPGI